MPQPSRPTPGPDREARAGRGPTRTRTRVRGTVLLAVLALCVGSFPALAQRAAAAAVPLDGWTGSWGAAPMAGQDNGCADCTIRNVIRVSRGGSQLRVTLSNEFGTTPLRINATVARPSTSTTAQVAPGTMRVLRFGGESAITIPVGTTMTSDPVDLSVADAGSILVSTFTPGYTTPMTVHDIGSQQSFFTSGRDASQETSAGAFPNRTEDRHFVTRVDVSGRSAGTVVAFGDSITDGVGSGQSNNARYPDFLATRLTSAGAQAGVVNSGISGNRVLLDGDGQRALDRFDRDVLDVPGVRSVVILEGINDIMRAPEGTDIGPLLDGLQQLIDRAHAADVRVVMGTLTPFQGWRDYTGVREASRLAVNRWIREHDDIEGVADFDAALRDPANPAQMRLVFDSGDRLHPGDAGYAAMADVVPLDVLVDPLLQVEFTQQPAELVGVDAGGQVTLSASARANRGDVAYQWQRRGVGADWAAVPAATGPELTLREVEASRGGEQYRVVATAQDVSEDVSAVSTLATLVVRAAPPVPPVTPVPPAPLAPPATAAPSPPAVPSDVRTRLSSVRPGARPVVRVRSSAAGSMRIVGRRGTVRLVRTVAVDQGTTRIRLPRRLTGTTGRLVVRLTLRPSAPGVVASRSTLAAVVRR